MLVAIGRCNLLHPGHVSLIQSVDLFVLSSGRLNLPVGDRLAMIERYADVPIDRIVVGNPYQVLESLRESENLTLRCIDESVSLANALGIPVQLIERREGLSSTQIREWVDTGNLEALNASIANPQWVVDLVALRQLELSR